jgi:NAD(P)-dependent dehydrogenase (short-subunit alcohol dehydrogenase family)
MVSKYVVPEMAKNGGGVIVNNASVAALQYDTMWAYNASKAAVIKMTKDMAYRYGRQNIRVNCVVPGLIDSALGRNRIAGNEKAAAQRQRIVQTMVPLRRQGTPEDIASAVAFLASDEASYCNGTCLVVDGGLSCR